MDDEAHSKSRSLPLLRAAIADCNECFSGFDAGRCRHHEDAVGGYGEQRIVLIGINPQGSKRDPVYAAIEALSGQERNRLGDRILELFVAERALRTAKTPLPELREKLRREVEVRFPEMPAIHAIPFDRHQGLRTWLPCVVERLGCAPETLRDHLTILESMKHTTANESELFRLRRRRDLDPFSRCRRWLEKQLGHINPCGVIFTGNSGIRLAHELDVLGSEERTTVGALHGTERKWRPSPGAPPIDVLFAFAFSSQTRGAWHRHASGSGRVRGWFHDRVRAREAHRSASSPPTLEDD